MNRSAGFSSPGMCLMVTPSAAQLTHLKELTVDVAGVCGSGIAVTEVMSGLTVSADLDWTILHVTKECRNLEHV